MTNKKVDPLKQAPAGVRRPHYACRLREDLHAWVKAECLRLNCSQGVFLEVLLFRAKYEKEQGHPLVSESEVFAYSSEDRWLAMGGIHGFSYLRSAVPLSR